MAYETFCYVLELCVSLSQRRSENEVSQQEKCKKVEEETHMVTWFRKLSREENRARMTHTPKVTAIEGTLLPRITQP